MARKTTPTHVLLNQITLAASSSSVTFSNIPQGYGDLVLVSNMGLTPDAANDTQIFVNNDASNIYTRVFMFGNGSGTESGSGTRTSFWGGYVSGTFGVCINQFIDYSATDKHKSLISSQNTTALGTSRQAQRWASNSAITSLKLQPLSTSSFLQGSTFSLYGVYA